MSSIAHLPNELILNVADYLDYSFDVAHLSQAYRYL